MENLSKYIKWKTEQINNCKDKTFASLFDLIHNQEDRIFCEYIDGIELKAISYTKFKEYCFKMANYLKSKLNSPKDSFVGLMMENSIDWVACFWGLLMIGYKPVLINCKLPIDINKQVANTMKINEIVTTSNLINDQFNLKFVVIERKEIIQQEQLQDFTWANEIALCTTASSLNYKICVYSGLNMFNQLANAEDVIKSYCPRIKQHYEGRLKLLAFLPLYHIFGLIATYLWFTLFGRTIVFLKDYSADTIISTIKEFKVTHIFSVPLFWNTLAKHINREIDSLDSKTKNKFIKGQKLSLVLQNINWKFGISIARKLFKQIINRTLGDSVKFVISGGGYQSDSTMKLFNSIGYPLAIGYGTSEIGIICFENRNKPKDRLLGTCGKPLKSVEVKVENNTLWVKGQSTCQYFYYKDGTRVDLNGQWFDTQDIATIDDKGYISILGRKDDVIVNDNGEKINPDLIEKQLYLPSVINYVVVSIKNKTTLIIQINERSNSLDFPIIVKEVEENVDRLSQQGYLIESIYYTNDQLAPENAIKVSRKILYKQLDLNKINLKPFNALKTLKIVPDSQLTNEFESEIKKVIGEVLNIDPSSIGTNKHLILDYGVTSLDYFTILSRLENEFNIKFVFKEKSCQTVASFAKYIIDSKKGANHG